MIGTAEAVKATLEKLLAESIRYERKITRSEYAQFDKGEAYLRVGPQVLGRELVMCVVIARVSIWPEYKSRGQFTEVCRVASEFAIRHGFTLVHECVGEPRLSAKHIRDGFHELTPGGLPSYYLTGAELQSSNPYKEKV